MKIIDSKEIEDKMEDMLEMIKGEMGFSCNRDLIGGEARFYKKGSLLRKRIIDLTFGGEALTIKLYDRTYLEKLKSVLLKIENKYDKEVFIYIK